MNIVIWLQSPNFQLLEMSLRVLEQNYGGLMIMGVVEQQPSQAEVLFNKQSIPKLDKKVLSIMPYDIIIINGQNATLQPIIDEAKMLGLDPDKIVLDRTVLMYGFSLERYKKLRHSQLSVISMGNWGEILNQMLSNCLAPGIGITAADADFLNFVRDPWRYVDVEFRSRVNWFNALVVMYTENPRVLAEFDRLPFAKKVCFVPFKPGLDSGYYIPPYYTGVMRSLLPAVNAIASSTIVCFDLWDVMLHNKKTPVNLASKAHGNTIMPSMCNRIKLDGRVKFLNWNPEVRYGLEDWFSNFIGNLNLGNKEFNFFSVYGDPRLIKVAQLERKILFSFEKLDFWPWYEGYEDYCLSSVNLALGCDYINAPNYLRLPGWFITSFKPSANRVEIENRIAQINSARNNRKYECVLISSHDMTHTREPIYNLLKNVLDIKCAGRWNNNTDELKTVYADDKMRYVREFMFNICPENVNGVGYVTEKLFDAFCAGSIPIYYGSNNRPEPGIINPSAVLFFDPNSDNRELVKEVQRLKFDETYYDKFMRQEKLFAKPAADYIQNTLEEFAKRLREMQ